MRLKTIGYVLSEFPVLSETFVGNEMRAMERRGHRVVPIVLKRPAAPGQAADARFAAAATYLDDVGVGAVLWGLLSIGAARRTRAFAASSFLFAQTSAPWYRLLIDALKVAAVAERNGCSHLHAHFADLAAACAITAGRWIGAGVSFVVHGRELYRGTPPEDLPLKLEAADFVVSVSEDLTSDLTEITPLPLIATIPYATDPAYFRVRDDEEDNGRMLFIGRLNVQKGLDDLIYALEALGPDCPRLDIIGDGPLRPYLQTIAEAKLPGRVRFLGARPTEWIATYGPAYRGLVGPYKVAPDGSRDTGPIVVKEAMAMGLPVVASRLMGIKETVTPDAGFLVEPGNVGELAAAIARLDALPTRQRREMGAAGRRRVMEHFTLDIQAEALSHLIEKA
ncbi:glycosyltransferase [Methylobrevis albus]|uniref:Glycosyltransferase n=1 Tax=Methylobrevis albus TaxID=2793297 RepID=A0A931I4G9_9HYPH|nr:glycosyltransferase [Methylobrevis albus]MBH0239045.1 glycosyltransferase [Methylobrevis albus]